MALGGTQVMQPSPVAAFQNAFPAHSANAATMALPQQQVAPVAASPNQTVRIQPGQVNIPQAAPQAAPPAAPAHFPPAPAQPAAAFSAPAPAAGFAAPAAQPAPAPTSKGASSAHSGNVVVELGTHSVSNFYKGLGGNDVIEHGGIFVATYKIPKIGAQVNLRILLPGDYEFQAAGVVQWIREPHSAGESSEPGFGARFVQITPEGRQLVYRYTRNREPMFYDDL
jgi:Tfp pilus assembly protein PilZ